jgi:hypothetical protein
VYGVEVCEDVGDVGVCRVKDHKYVVNVSDLADNFVFLGDGGEVFVLCVLQENFCD